MPTEDKTGSESEKPTTSSDRPPALTSEEITELLEYFCRNLVKLAYSNHFKQRCASRGIYQSDVIRVLSMGRLVGVPQWRDTSNTWTYGVRGNDIDGDEIEFRIAISDDRETIILVTVLDPN